MIFSKEVLNKGFIALEDSYGSDLTIVNAARQSFNQKSTEMGSYEIGLLNFLMRERHGTPWEFVDFRFNIKCPISVAREWFRHRVGSFNEMSGRYKKLDPDFYIPPKEYIRTQVGKPGNYTFEKIECNNNYHVHQQMEECYSYCWETYEKLLDLGLAKEVARNVLPVGIYTCFSWKVNLRSLLNFISLRSHETAMLEIRKYSEAIEPMVACIVPHAWEAFEKHGRIAP